MLLLTSTFDVFGQIKSEGFSDKNFPTFYQQRSSLFRLLPVTKNDIIFLGNSITNGNEWDELFGDIAIKNRGISGDVTAGILNRLDEVTYRKSAKIFLLIGVNDLAAGSAPDTVAQKIWRIATRIHQETPATQLYIQSILPVNDVYNKFPGHVNKGEQVRQTNALLKAGAGIHNYNFIDLYPAFCDNTQKLDTLYTNDGLHQKGAGYILWKHLIYPYVYNLQSKPSLLPQPHSITWTNTNFELYRCRFIVVKDTTFNTEALMLQNALREKGLETQIIDHQPEYNTPVIVLEKKHISTTGINDEAYSLKADQYTVNIQANTPHGCFNALQTLYQLMRDNCIVSGVDITDYPDLAWRGYMVDVGRNFESVAMLKQQIEVMARYKLNVFHLHLTEDIAWRLQIKQYPQLIQPQNMQRNAGAYYSVNELQNLIQFCKDRFITLIPEIDVPGHSAAFKRAFNCDMQSDTGIAIVKNILKEFCETYDVPYLHIGGDEVKIINKNFLPIVEQYIQQLGKLTIGWSPGGNLDKSTIRQLWMKDGAVDPHLKYIDSRNLYINHMDPLESVTSIFNRRLESKNGGNLLGAELCLWPDRNVISQEDVLTTNPVYPAMLTFAERSWRIGGVTDWHTDIVAGSDEFADFEDRLIDQQKQYFSQIPFRYIKQTGVKWKLLGPYANKGNLAATFAPEKAGFDPEKGKYQPVTGATVILRHFWFPEVKSVLTNPVDSTTYYAFAKVWSNRDTTALMWIGFYNISRSVPTSTPALNTWDDRGSQIWLNDQIVSPPVWARVAQTGNIEKPLIDEGYEYRSPTVVTMHKGWNRILVKLPVGSFRSAKIQNPVKWMFTAVFVKALGNNFIADNQFSFSAN